MDQFSLLPAWEIGGFDADSPRDPVWLAGLDQTDPRRTAAGDPDQWPDRHVPACSPERPSEARTLWLLLLLHDRAMMPASFLIQASPE